MVQEVTGQRGCELMDPIANRLVLQAPAPDQTDLPPFGNGRLDGICLRKSFYLRPLRGLVRRRVLAFLRDNSGGFNLGNASSTSVCAAG